MITKEQLQAMSDFEVNKALTLCTSLGKVFSGIDEFNSIMTGAVTDYCNTPNDIMPLQIEHKINILWHADEQQWMAMNFYGKFMDENLLRAIACCLILVLQEKNDE